LADFMGACRYTAATLAIHYPEAHAKLIMKSRRWHRLQAFALAVVLGLGLSLAAFQTNAMSPDMAMSTDAGDQGHRSCDGCPGGDDIDLGACMAMCWAGGPVLLQDGFGPLAISRIQESKLPADADTGCLTHHLDPDPPKTLILG
jgi:hypothetical protein